MLRWVGWAARTVATAILLSFLCIWTTGYIVNSYMETLLKQLNLPLETRPFALSGMWGTLWGADEPAAKETVSSPEPTKNNPEPAPEPGPAPADDGVNGSLRNDGESVPVMGERSEEDAPSGVSGEYGGQDAQTGQEDEGVSGAQDEQRQQVYQSVLSKLNAEQLGQLSDYLKDGLTVDELQQIGALLKDVLSEEELSQMMDILRSAVKTETT